MTGLVDKVVGWLRPDTRNERSSKAEQLRQLELEDRRLERTAPPPPRPKRYLFRLRHRE